MRYYFSLRIDAKPEQKDKITNILGIESNYPQVAWGHELKTKRNEYVNFIDYFVGILEGNFDKLQDIGITKDDITLWMVYEYDGQCNMEFNPTDIKKLGDSGITLCISCYEATTNK